LARATIFAVTGLHAKHIEVAFQEPSFFLVVSIALASSAVPPAKVVGEA